MRNPEGLGGVSPGGEKSQHAIESSIINDIGIPLGLQAKFRPLFSISGTSEGVLLPALYKVLLSPPTYCSYVFL